MRLLLLFLITVCLNSSGYSQILEKIENEAKNRKDRKEDEIIDEGFDKIEDIFKRKDKGKENKEEEIDEEEETTQDNSSDNNADEVEVTESGTNSADEVVIWTEKYDFVPGEEIIFYDDFEDEAIGDIPVQWSYEKGMLEIVEVSGAGKVLSGDMFSHPNWEDGFELPDRYTIEFDVYMHPEKLNHQYTYILRFLDKDYRQNKGSVYIRNDGTLELHGVASGKVPGATADTYRGKWVHISLSVNSNSIKGYWDQYRLFNARFTDNAIPKAIRFWNCCLPDDRPNIFLLDNFKIAEGAHEVSEEKVLEDGKIVTHNILFEVNSDVLLPRSYAEIKRIADLMEKYPDLVFSVEGHTDSDGSDTHNQDLSERRAKATMDALIGMGVSAERLSYKGLGESDPISDNTTPKGKALNRRVEFVRVE